VKRTLIAIVAVASLVPASVAWAHAELKSVSPRKNSTRQAVREVHATFSQVLVTGTITIKNANGHVISLRANGLKPSNRRVLRAVPRVALATGSYTVGWRARAADGHTQTGSWKFRVRR
jgi:methionine-rich copper-binding protein CopC